MAPPNPALRGILLMIVPLGLFRAGHRRLAVKKAS